MQTTRAEIPEFTDAIVAYHQYADEMGLSEAQAKKNPHTLEEFLRAAEAVKQSSELQVAYVGLASGRKRDRDASLEVVRAVERSIINGHFDTEHIDSGEFKEELTKLEDEDWLQQRAELFVGIFSSVIAKDIIPASLRLNRPNAKSPRKGPRQASAQNIKVDISEHGTIGINNQYLRELTQAQKFTILAGLSNKGGFRNIDIYGSSEFGSLFGKGKTIEDLKSIYDEAFEELCAMLHEKGFSRLIDANRRPGERKHHIEAQGGVNDKRAIAKQQQPNRGVFARAAATAEARAWGAAQQPSITVEQNEPAATFSQDMIADGRRITINLIESVEGAARSAVIDVVARKLSIDPLMAKSLVAEVYRLERESEHPVFTQTKKGGKRFVSIQEESASDTVETSTYGPYFEGSQEAFVNRYGSTKCVTPEFVKYENGVIDFKGLEAQIISYFSGSGERRAIAEKTVLAYLAQRGTVVTKQELRDSAGLINQLVGKEFFRLMSPAGRVESSKGPRIQAVGTFAESA
jgi:hypothetical protein